GAGGPGAGARGGGVRRRPHLAAGGRPPPQRLGVGRAHPDPVPRPDRGAVDRAHTRPARADRAATAGGADPAGAARHRHLRQRPPAVRAGPVPARWLPVALLLGLAVVLRISTLIYHDISGADATVALLAKHILAGERLPGFFYPPAYIGPGSGLHRPPAVLVLCP